MDWRDPAELICADVLELLRHTEESVQGRPRADAVLVLPPFYFAGPLAPGVEAFLRECLTATALPAFLYHFPAHVQQSVSPEMYARLAKECSNLVGIKASTHARSHPSTPIHAHRSPLAGAHTDIHAVLYVQLNALSYVDHADTHQRVSTMVLYSYQRVLFLALWDV